MRLGVEFAPFLSWVAPAGRLILSIAPTLSPPRSLAQPRVTQRTFPRTPKPPASHPMHRLRPLVALLALFPATAGIAQTAPATSAAAKPPEENSQTITLAAFEVNTNRDVGYT